MPYAIRRPITMVEHLRYKAISQDSSTPLAQLHAESVLNALERSAGHVFWSWSGAWTLEGVPREYTAQGAAKGVITRQKLGAQHRGVEVVQTPDAPSQ
jgi:hypothetical protein